MSTVGNKSLSFHGAYRYQRRDWRRASSVALPPSQTEISTRSFRTRIWGEAK